MSILLRAQAKCPPLAEVVRLADRRIGEHTAYVSHGGWLLILDRGRPIQFDRGTAPEGVRTWTVEEAMNLLRARDVAPIRRRRNSDKPRYVKASGPSIGGAMDDVSEWVYAHEEENPTAADVAKGTGRPLSDIEFLIKGYVLDRDSDGTIRVCEEV